MTAKPTPSRRPRRAAPLAPRAAAQGRAVAPAPGSVPTSDEFQAYVTEAQAAVVRGEHPRLTVDVFAPHWRERFSDEELHAVVIPKRTLARRVKAGEPLTADETDRALRLARVATQADRVFGDPQKAARWLRKPNRAAGNQSPLALLETETGAKLVEDMLVRIEYGMIG